MLDELKNAARNLNGARQLRGLLIDCRRLLSERGEANSVAIARDLVARFRELPDAAQATFFERLSRDFSPDPKAVLASARAYAETPNAATLQRLTQAAEPPRQELLRRINRSPGGTGSIVAMRRALLPRVISEPLTARPDEKCRGTHRPTCAARTLRATAHATHCPRFRPDAA